MTIDSLTSWVNIAHIQYASHILVHKAWENHLDGQDKSSLQLGGSALYFQMDYLNQWTDYGQLITMKGTYDLYLLCNS